MDDLVSYIIPLLTGDATMQEIFAKAQSTPSLAQSVVRKEQREKAGYPRIVIEAHEDSQHTFGENVGAAKFFDGKLRVTIVTRQDDVDTDAYEILVEIKNRVRDLLLGNKTANLAGIKGQAVSTDWRVDVFNQIAPTGELPVTEPTMYRHLATYKVLMNRITY